MSLNHKAVILLGPTACGKTAFGVSLAERLDAEIVSADSRQVYRGLDIGSGKDLAEYTLPSGLQIPAHLIDIADPCEAFTLADFLKTAREAFAQIAARGKLPLVVGGTALYLHALLSAYELKPGVHDDSERTRMRALSTPELHEILRSLEPESRVIREEPDNRPRIIRRIELLRLDREPAPRATEIPDDETRFLILGVFRPRSEIHERIERRLDDRLAEGMVEEAVRLHEAGVPWERLEFLGLEYRYLALYLQGKMTLAEMRDTLLHKIRQFAKRQDSWFRKIERDGFPIYWQKPDGVENAVSLCRDYLADKPIPQPEFRLEDCCFGPRQKRPR